MEGQSSTQECACVLCARVTCLAGEVQLNGLDTDVLRTSSHDLWCGCVVVEGEGQVAWDWRGGLHRLSILVRKEYARATTAKAVSCRPMLATNLGLNNANFPFAGGFPAPLHFEITHVKAPRGTGRTAASTRRAALQLSCLLPASTRPSPPSPLAGHRESEECGAIVQLR